MHQSPQKLIGVRRDRNAVYAAFELADAEAERRLLQRGSQPKARKSGRRDLPVQDRPGRDEERD